MAVDAVGWCRGPPLSFGGEPTSPQRGDSSPAGQATKHIFVRSNWGIAAQDRAGSRR